VTDAHGAVVEFHNYTPFGVEVTPPTGFTPRLFAGKQHDSETTFDYFGGRYLTATAGRFTSVDPVVDSSSTIFEPQGWGRYSYVRNNPVRFVDPDGRNPLLIAFAVGALVYYHEARLNAPAPGQELITDRSIGDLVWDAAINSIGDGVMAGIRNLGGSLLSRGIARVAESRLGATAAQAVHFHHAWPKYLGGPTEQLLEPLPKALHDAYHSGLDKILPRQIGTEFYQTMSATERKVMERELLEYTRAFDAKYGTKLYNAMVREGFGAVR
jgi:RHS repeat-associated protein